MKRTAGRFVEMTVFFLLAGQRRLGLDISLSMALAADRPHLGYQPLAERGEDVTVVMRVVENRVAPLSATRSAR